MTVQDSYLLLGEALGERAEYWVHVDTVHLDEEVGLVILIAGRLPLWITHTHTHPSVSYMQSSQQAKRVALNSAWFMPL